MNTLQSNNSIMKNASTQMVVARLLPRIMVPVRGNIMKLHDQGANMQCHIMAPKSRHSIKRDSNAVIMQVIPSSIIMHASIMQSDRLALAADEHVYWDDEERDVDFRLFREVH